MPSPPPPILHFPAKLNQSPHHSSRSSSSTNLHHPSYSFTEPVGFSLPHQKSQPPNSNPQPLPTTINHGNFPSQHQHKPWPQSPSPLTNYHHRFSITHLIITNSQTGLTTSKHQNHNPDSCPQSHWQRNSPANTNPKVHQHSRSS